MSIICNDIEKISLIGLGYVGLPLAIAFAEKNIEVIGFDVNKEKIKEYLSGNDVTGEVGNERLKKVENIRFTSDQNELKNSKFHIVAVPTPVKKDKSPNFEPLKSASRVVGKNMVRGSIVVFESTVYPGATEEICIPILEQESGLKCGIDFKIGYSPERINPGDKLHRLENIIKITAGMDEESSEIIAQVYEKIIFAGIYRAPSIKIAEAAKVIENTQRDINIAFMNELSLVFDKMGIDTQEVLKAANTKWNFLNFTPGLVGGHCIGVDPYYLAFRAEEFGYHPQLILAGRKINDSIGKFIAEKTVKKIIAGGRALKGSKVLIMGITFKEDCPDLRNSKVVDIINELKDYEVEVYTVDPIASSLEAEEEYGVKLADLNTLNEKMDGIILSVKHSNYIDMKPMELLKYFNNIGNPILMDVKGIFDKNEVSEIFDYWRL